MSDSGELQGLPLEGLDIAPTPEQIAGKVSNRIFRPWYKQYYEGHYTQSPAFIARVLKQTVLKCVIEGEDSEETVIRAMQMLGLKQQVITEASLQYSLSVARSEAESRKQASIWHEEASGMRNTDGDTNANSNDHVNTDEQDNEESLDPWTARWQEAMKAEEGDVKDAW